MHLNYLLIFLAIIYYVFSVFFTLGYFKPDAWKNNRPGEVLLLISILSGWLILPVLLILILLYLFLMALIYPTQAITRFFKAIIDLGTHFSEFIDGLF